MFAAPWTWRRPVAVLLRSGLSSSHRYASTDTKLTPALLQRARTLTAEHAALTSTIATTFDARSAKRIGELSSVASALRAWEKAHESLVELQSLSSSDDAELRALAADEIGATRLQAAKLEQSLAEALTPKHDFDAMPCLLEIRPGPGGLEGRFFADSLVRMYKGYLSRKGLRVRTVKYELSDTAGDSTGSFRENALQEAVLEVEDENAYALLRGEAGMHRVQRVPATESKGRTHTSAVAVWVLPSFPESATQATDLDDPESDFYVDPADVRQEVTKARGAGGQHVNKTESAVRLVHIPTGTTVSMQDSRSQHQNREKAWRLLRARLAQQRREDREAQARELRDSVLAKDRITRADKVRTYNYQQDRCTDHRSGAEVRNLPDVLAGGEGLDKIVESVRAWNVAREIEAMVAEEERRSKSEVR